jgi:hypothetical protein
MIETLTIKNISTKSGISKNGRGYNLVTIEDTGGRRLSMYIDKEFDLKLKKMEKLQDFQEGATVTVKTEQNGEFTNFDIAGKYDLLEDRVRRIEEVIANAQSKKGN